jgi:hypothetical protein
MLTGTNFTVALGAVPQDDAAALTRSAPFTRSTPLALANREFLDG